MTFGTDPARRFYRIVTVGTPFYGTAVPLDHFHKGNPVLNRLCGGREAFARVIASFPGIGVLHFLDRATYKIYGRVFAQRGETPELSRYPARHGTCSEQGAYAEP